MFGRLLGLLVVLPLMLLCIRSPCESRVCMLAAVACVFFAYETYCILYMQPRTFSLGISEQCIRFFTLFCFCPLLVWCAHQLLNDGDVTRAKLILIVAAIVFGLYEWGMICCALQSVLAN